MKPVHVFGRLDGFDDALRIDVRRQRQLHQDSVHFVARVQLRNQCQQFECRNRGGRSAQPTSESKLLARGDLASHINLRRRVLAYQYRREPGPNSLTAQCSDLVLELSVNLVPDRYAVENAGWHKGSLHDGQSIVLIYGSTADPASCIGALASAASFTVVASVKFSYNRLSSGGRNESDFRRERRTEETRTAAAGRGPLASRAIAHVE